MNVSIEYFDADNSFAVFTRDDDDAREQLMALTGHFLNLLDHVSRFHHQVITPGYVWDVFDDLEHMQMKHNWPEARPD